MVKKKKKDPIIIPEDEFTNEQVLDITTIEQDQGKIKDTQTKAPLKSKAIIFTPEEVEESKAYEFFQKTSLGRNFIDFVSAGVPGRVLKSKDYQALLQTENQQKIQKAIAEGPDQAVKEYLASRLAAIKRFQEAQKAQTEGRVQSRKSSLTRLGRLCEKSYNIRYFPPPLTPVLVMLPVERQLHRLDGLEMPLQAEQDLTLLVRDESLRFRNSHNLPSRVSHWKQQADLAAIEDGKMCVREVQEILESCNDLIEGLLAGKARLVVQGVSLAESVLPQQIEDESLKPIREQIRNYIKAIAEIQGHEIEKIEQDMQRELDRLGDTKDFSNEAGDQL